MKTTDDSVAAISLPPATADQGDETQHASPEPASTSKLRRKQVIAIGALIFLATFCARLLYWHSARLDAAKVESMATAGYRDIARHIVRGGFASFFSPSSPLASPNTISYQPGYSLLMALFYRLFGEWDAALQFFQMTCDAAAALMVFLIAAELLPAGAAIIGGALAALSPQFSWYSIVLLPDSMGVLPILCAAYCLIRAHGRPRLALVIAAGLLIGLSCWLRANGLLLAPFLAVTLIPLLFERGRRVRYALALVCATFLILAPLFIRNWIIHGYFPVFSLRAGNTMVEGIADYDTEGRFGLPRTDLSLMKWESEIYNRPDYYGNLFEPDGIERERMRLKRGLAVIRSHPFWFAGVMARRGASMLRLGRVHLISTEPPVTHTLPSSEEESSPPVWTSSPAEMLAQSTLLSPQAKVTLTPDGAALFVTGDDSKYGTQLAFAPIPVQENHDYLLTIPIRVEQGRMTASVLSENRSTTYASTVVEAMEGKTPAEQPLSTIELPFVSREAGRIRVVFSNGASKPSHPLIEVGQIKVFALGTASYLWTRYPRLGLWLAQRLFITAFMLPLAIVGAVLLGLSRRWRVLLILLAVPAYYFCVQSALHTEYRYVLAIHDFLFMLAALALYQLGDLSWRGLRKSSSLRKVKRQAQRTQSTSQRSQKSNSFANHFAPFAFKSLFIKPLCSGRPGRII
jgi:4-amino-4-deoxy-L-arabinose transferase-like glycosyltransferase